MESPFDCSFALDAFESYSYDNFAEEPQGQQEANNAYIVKQPFPCSVMKGDICSLFVETTFGVECIAGVEVSFQPCDNRNKKVIQPLSVEFEEKDEKLIEVKVKMDSTFKKSYFVLIRIHTVDQSSSIRRRFHLCAIRTRSKWMTPTMSF